MPTKTIVYYRRGSVERYTSKGYVWKDAYSANGFDGGILYPWLTKKEARKDAESQNAKAVFKD